MDIVGLLDSRFEINLTAEKKALQKVQRLYKVQLQLEVSLSSRDKDVFLT